MQTTTHATASLIEPGQILVLRKYGPNGLRSTRFGLVADIPRRKSAFATLITEQGVETIAHQGGWTVAAPAPRISPRTARLLKKDRPAGFPKR